jgi:hypothetical protein
MPLVLLSQWAHQMQQSHEMPLVLSQWEHQMQQSHQKKLEHNQYLTAQAHLDYQIQQHWHL